MKDEEIIAMARKHETNNPFMTYHKLSRDGLIAFARAIADIQKQKDALICDNCPKRGEQ